MQNVEDALRIFGVLFTTFAIPFCVYIVCVKLATWASTISVKSRRLQQLGVFLIAVGIVLQLTAIGLFTWREPLPPRWLGVLGTIGFWVWWAFIVAGAACFWVGSRTRLE